MPKDKKATTVKDAIRILTGGNTSEIARELEVSNQAVHTWKKTNKMPEKRAKQLAELYSDYSSRIEFMALVGEAKEPPRSVRLRSLINQMGGIQTVADEFDLSRSAISKWIKTGHVPDAYLANFIHWIVELELPSVKFEDFTEKSKEHIKYLCAAIQSFEDAYA